MSMRVYQFIAVAILIIAPVVANIVSTAAPGGQPAAETPAPAVDNGSAASAEVRPVPAPPPALPDPYRNGQGSEAASQTAVSSDPAVDAAPTLDVNGMAVGAASEGPADPPPS